MSSGSIYDNLNDMEFFSDLQGKVRSREKWILVLFYIEATTRFPELDEDKYRLKPNS